MAIPVDVIKRQLSATISDTDLPGSLEKYRGKVRETYVSQTGELLLITTDRISAFDHILPRGIPFKGQVLNQIAAFFFEQTADIVKNHVIAVPDPNVTVGLKCDVVPIEFVVRGYVAGHAWREYRDGKRMLCGQSLPDGLKESSKLPTPILTPATKATSGHDEDISLIEIVERGIISAGLLDQLEATALALFERGTEIAARRGLILVDTKYEFGLDADGSPVLIDEVHTPDSSRYYYSDTYASCLSEGKSQRQLSKEFVREWLIANDFQGKEGQTMPDLPDDFRVEISQRYAELFTVVTGKEFEPDTHPDPAARMNEALAPWLSG